MKLLDVNVLVYAQRESVAEHAVYAAWLNELATGREAFGVSDLVASGFVRVVTNTRVFPEPTELNTALSFIEELRVRPNHVLVAPGPRHWQIFENLLRATNASGNLVSDAYHAALAIETGAEWISADKDFARFPGLRWRDPFKEA